MRFLHKRLDALLLVLTVIPAVPLASVFLFWGVHSLLNPFVPQELLAQNTLVCAVLILTAAALIYALFRPYPGGLLLCIWAVPFGLILNAFRRSIFGALYPSMEAGYRPIFAAISGLVLLLGVLFVFRGRRSRRAPSEGPAQGHGACPAAPRYCGGE
jgi:hypothetical protein